MAKNLGLDEAGYSPDQESLQRSQCLQQDIVKAIHQHGPMRFVDFMQRALYTPGLGYYQCNANLIGERGDFITAPELTPMFAQCLARQCGQIFQQIDQTHILEFGAGSGRLAADLLLALDADHALPDKYFIMEISSSLRASQQQILETLAPSLLSKVVWLDRLPETFHGIVIANEVLDAMPVHLVKFNAAGHAERHVDWQNAFVWHDKPLNNPRLLQRAESICAMHALPDEYCSEINLVAEDWLTSVAHRLGQAVMLIIDYGFPRHEFYHPQRNQGTLMCHYRHHAHTDPFQWLGLQDITAHIDFSALADAAISTGLQLCGYTSQAYFLIGNGLEKIAADNATVDPRKQIEQNQAIKKLTLPGEMGELFKVIAFGSQCAPEMDGFREFDHSHKL